MDYKTIKEIFKKYNDMGYNKKIFMSMTAFKELLSNIEIVNMYFRASLTSQKQILRKLKNDGDREGEIKWSKVLRKKLKEGFVGQIHINGEMIDIFIDNTN